MALARIVCLPGRAARRGALLALALLCGAWPSARTAAANLPEIVQLRTFDVNEYRVLGADLLTQVELEGILGPFLGPGRKLSDVEDARAALEKAYADKGYQAVTVAIPPQTVKGGVVTLQVTEGKIDRLRVRGARYFLPSEVKRLAPSLAEGKVPNLEAMVKDIVALNQLPDRRVTPVLRAGEIPGTVEVDLDVNDELPLHGSLEVNNRHSPGTTATRVNGSVRYDNLWQLGHSLTLAFQLAPQRLKDGEVFSASYLARFADTPWLSLGLSGLLQESDVSTLGSIAVSGRGQVLGARASFTLPGSASFFQGLSAGLDYKRFHEAVSFGTDTQRNPIEYWPATLQYSASLLAGSSHTEMGAAVVSNIRALSSSTARFDAKRYGASANFTYFRGSAEHTHDLPLRFQAYLRGQGQYTADPLVGSEQFTVGGADSVRGYLEAQAAGDYGVAATAELRGPALDVGGALEGWRLHLFSDFGRVRVRETPPGQTALFHLLSLGGGTRLKLLRHLAGTVEVGLPLTSIGTTRAHHPRLLFQVAGDF
ncbi:MAG TPA: ShlB/FhaC/HecB family hemolysin secretion/activation protein [Anaeromyxobacter sp.]|nr:ShlB/FhaC/HecB family hemolysin secretion/activation protein [Anaeromyxobacter sp.]